MLKQVLMLLCIVMLAGCGIMQPNPPAAPAGSAPSAPKSGSLTPLGEKKSGDLTVKLFSEKNPPSRGANMLLAHLDGPNGQPVADAKISFDLDMTNMSHGKTVVQAAAVGAGDYSGRVNFMMAGPWRVIVAIDQGGQTSTVRFDFTVKSQ